ncbi:MAG: hypothetical protein IJB74_08845 [Clostridia bacterium]|nr:hypothetical protein [Clostridia bacterium]
MKFNLFTPHRQYPSFECDSVKLPVADSVSGKFSGSYGIRRGHAKAVFALTEGKIIVSFAEKEIFSAECDGGFATVENDEVRVTADGIKEK